MKLLFDANLSPKLATRLSDLFPGSTHVFDSGLAHSTKDEEIWTFAAAEGYTIVTADRDFVDLARTRGAPPHVVHLENCDYRTARVESVLRRNAVRIADLEHSARGMITLRKAE